MISRITGQLLAIEGNIAHVDPGFGLTYEVMLSNYTAKQLAVETSKPVTLQTIHYIEGSSSSTSFVPRLAGFVTAADREFFERFTTVKGIGPRKALRAMAIDSSQIAAAIQDRDLKMLQALPEIGRRMAETVVATLHGKLDAFISAAAYGKKSGEAAAGAAAGASPVGGRSAASETLEILLQLGENRTHAMDWINEVLQRNPDLTDSQQLLAEVLRLKAGV